MQDEEDPDESTLDLLPFTSGCGPVERITDPFAEVDHVAETTSRYEDESGGLITSGSLPHTSGTMPKVRRGVEESAGGAPSLVIEDSPTDTTLKRTVHTYDDEDDRPRMNWAKFPNYPHRKETETFHPMTSGTTAMVSGGGKAETNWSEWPDQS